MAAKIYYQEDCNLSMLEGKTIAVIGYGSQGPRACSECERIRMSCDYRTVRRIQILAEGCGSGL